MLHLGITETVPYIGCQENVPTTYHSTKMKYKLLFSLSANIERDKSELLSLFSNETTSLEHYMNIFLRYSFCSSEKHTGV
jgi:hypothetical protein